MSWRSIWRSGRCCCLFRRGWRGFRVMAKAAALWMAMGAVKAALYATVVPLVYALAATVGRKRHAESMRKENEL